MSDNRTIYQALIDARADFDPVVKDSTNPHYKNRYASLAAVLAAVEPALVKHGLVLVQRTEVRDNGLVVLITELAQSGTASVLAMEYPLLPAKQNDPQALGGCLTYARRYSILCLCGVAAEDDDGNTASEQPAPRRERRTVAQVQDDVALRAELLRLTKDSVRPLVEDGAAKQYLERYAKSLDVGAQPILDHLHLASWKQLQGKHFAQALAFLDRIKADKAIEAATHK